MPADLKPCLLPLMPAQQYPAAVRVHDQRRRGQMQGQRAQPRVGRRPHEGTHPLDVSELRAAPGPVAAEQGPGIHPAILSATPPRHPLPAPASRSFPGPGNRSVGVVTTDDVRPGDGVAPEDGIAPEDAALPAVPVSAGAMIFDRAGRLLILKPTYKSGWTIPGGVMEADGETPWEACRREVAEECGLDVGTGRLACMDFRRPRPGRPGGIRYLFDCGAFSDASLAGIVVQPEEISEYRLAELGTALALLRKPIRRRVRAAADGGRPCYLEDGRPVPGVGGPR